MGLKQAQVKEYWKERSSEFGATTVGLHGSTIEEQDARYEERKDFIFKRVRKDLRTLDYGCGIGRYSIDFENYIGVDVTKTLVDIAKANHPDKEFILLESPVISKELEDYNWDMLFTATVLQHNDDEGVRRILESVKQIQAGGFTFCLYENAVANASHIKARTTEDYVDLISDADFLIHSFGSYHHTIHGEKHILSVIEV